MYAHYEDVIKDLLTKGVPQEKIIVVGYYDIKISENMYFDSEIIGKYDLDNLFIDCGSYDGKDTEKFAVFNGVSIHDVNAMLFEPDIDSYNKLLKRFDGCEGIVCINGATSNIANQKIGFNQGKGEGSHISTDSQNTVKTYTIDNSINDKNVGYIKMDVEGYEFETLKGAEKTILINKPDLAISVYHKREDIVELARYVIDLNPNYKLWLRHYTISYGDTVLYAIV